MLDLAGRFAPYRADRVPGKPLSPAGGSSHTSSSSTSSWFQFPPCCTRVPSSLCQWGLSGPAVVHDWGCLVAGIGPGRSSTLSHLSQQSPLQAIGLQTQGSVVGPPEAASGVQFSSAGPSPSPVLGIGATLTDSPLSVPKVAHSTWQGRERPGSSSASSTGTGGGCLLVVYGFVCFARCCMLLASCTWRPDSG